MVKSLKKRFSNNHGATIMRLTLVLCISIFFLIQQVALAKAEKFIVVENDLHWYSANLTEIPVDQIHTIQFKKDYFPAYHTPLGHMAYNKHFDTFGSPPPLNFLRPLERGSSLAKIEGKYVVFMRAGRKIPLNSSIVPSWADPTNPYLLSVPDLDRIFVAYPYYSFGKKGYKYFTEIYSDTGALMGTFDTLPTHFSMSNPYLLISYERSCCSNPTTWGIRFFDLHQGSVSGYTCPEGFCGDVLFTKLGKKGPFVLAHGIIGMVSGIGASVQTNIYVIENDGTLSSSGTIIHAVHDPNFSKHMMQDVSPYAVSNLVAIDPLPEKNSWLIQFGIENGKSAFKLVSINKDPTSSMVYLLSQDTYGYEKRGIVMMAEKTLGNLPLIGIAEPGRHIFSVVFDDDTSEATVMIGESDRVKMVMF